MAYAASVPSRSEWRPFARWLFHNAAFFTPALVIGFRVYTFDRVRMLPLALGLFFWAQMNSFERERRRPRLTDRDRLFWVWLSRVWADWTRRDAFHVPLGGMLSAAVSEQRTLC